MTAEHPCPFAESVARVSASISQSANSTTMERAIAELLTYCRSLEQRIETLESYPRTINRGNAL